MPAADPALEAWKRAVLNAGLDDVLAGHPLPTPAAGVWCELLEWADRERVLGLLWQLANQLGVGSQPFEDLSTRWKAVAHSTLAVEGSIPSVADALDAAGIDWRVMKGIATSRLLYGASGLRTFGDIDILVRPADLERTLEALRPITAVGATPLHGPFRSEALQERKVTDLRGVELDVHRAVEGSLVTSRLPVEPFFARPQELKVSGRIVLTPSIEVSFVHAVMHFSSAGRRLSTVPDIARLIPRVEANDPTVHAMLCTRTSQSLFHWALSSAAEWITLPGGWTQFLSDNRPSNMETRTVRWIQRTPSRSSVLNVFLGGHKLRRGLETLWPSEEFLTHMQTDHLGHLRHLLAKGSHL